MEYLAFEAPIREMDEQLERTRAMAQESDVDLSEARSALIRAWDLIGPSVAPATPGAGRQGAAKSNRGAGSGASTDLDPEPDRTEAVEAFARGRERGEDRADEAGEAEGRVVRGDHAVADVVLHADALDVHRRVDRPEPEADDDQRDERAESAWVG